MIVSLLATLLFCGCIILLFGAIFFLSKKVGVPDASYRHKYSQRRYWNRIFFKGGVTRGSLIASERFTNMMSTGRSSSGRQRQHRPWEPRS